MFDRRFWDKQPAFCDDVASSLNLDRELDIPAASTSHEPSDAVASSSRNSDQELDIPTASRSQDNAAASDVFENQELLDSQETPLPVAPISEILNNVLVEVGHEEERMEDGANLSGVSEPSSDDSSADGAESDETLPVSESSNSSLSVSDISDDDDDDAGSEKLYADCEYTTGEAILLVMDLYLTRKLDKKSLSSTLALLHKLLPRPNNLPKTEYLLFQYLESLSPLPQSIVHYYCSVCLYYLGINEADLKCKVCTSPDPANPAAKTPAKKFFELPIADHIRNLFENHGLAEVLDGYNPQYAPNCISDVCHGTVYIRVKVPGRYNLTLMLYTDGVQLAESSNASLWPLMFVILELPPRLRFKFLVVSGVWFDTQKPVMNTFLKPFVKSLQEIAETGIKWTHPKTNIEHVTFCHAPLICADAPARAQVQNILSHGGRYSCHCCEQKTVKLPKETVLPGVKKKARRRVFTFKEVPSKFRTDSNMRRHGLMTYNERVANPNIKQLRPKRGVKGLSIVSQIPKLDISTCVYAESMHLLSGILKQFLKMWFSALGPKFSISSHQDSIDRFLIDIKPPDFISRLPRETFMGKWKANELYYFLMLYSLPALREAMDDTYFQHWMLLVIAIYLLNQDTISESDLTTADLLLKLFLRDFAALYKREEFTYNLHQLNHLVLYVRRSGNLWANSAYRFESFNGVLIGLIHGSKHQGQELVKNLRIAQGVHILRSQLGWVQGQPIRQDSIKLSNALKMFVFTDNDQEFLRSAGCSTATPVYQRAKMNQQIFTTYLYTRQKRRNNYTVAVSLPSGSRHYGELKFFFKTNSGAVMAVLRNLQVVHANMFFHRETMARVKHILPIQTTGSFILISADQILHKVIRVGEYICMLPNKFEVFM